MAKDDVKVITSEVTLSYPNLLAARAGKGANAKAKFSAALVIFPEQQKTEAGQKMLAALKQAAMNAAETRWGNKAAEMFRIKDLRSPFRDDAERKGYPAGSIFINARTENKPACVFAYPDPANPSKPKKMTDEEVKTQMYAGARVRASLVAFPYDVDGNKGVGFALNNLQKVGEGERIDGRVAAEDEFDVDLSQAPADISGLI